MNTSDIKIIEEANEDYMEAPHELLFQQPFSLLFQGIKGTGKTTLLDTFLHIYAPEVDDIVVFSPTFKKKLDKKTIEMTKEYKIKKRNIYKCYNEEVLKKIMEMIGNENAGKDMCDKKKVLIIFDDCVCSIPTQGQTIINDLALNMRHYFISFIILSQSFKKISPTLRANFTGYVLWKQWNQAEKAKIIEELSGDLGKDKFTELFDTATEKKYEFLGINTQHIGNSSLVYTQSFKTKLLDDNNNLLRIKI